MSNFPEKPIDGALAEVRKMLTAQLFSINMIKTKQPEDCREAKWW